MVFVDLSIFSHGTIRAMQKFLCVLFVLLTTTTSTWADIGVCTSSWRECHRFLSSELPTRPKAELRTDVLHGKPVRVTITKDTYTESFLLDNVNMNAAVICGEAQDRMTSPITESANFQPIIVCTDGYASYLNVSASRWGANPQSTKWLLDSISFKTRAITPTHKPVVTHYLDGSSTEPEENNIVKASFNAEIRGVMLDRGYSFTMENTHYNNRTGHVSGQSLSHISQSYTNAGGIVFRTDPYYWLSSWETTGKRDSARFSVGDLKPLRHTNDFVALQWFADVCWETVYVHDEYGHRQKGNIDLLKMYIRMGHRVRVHFNGYTVEASSLLISPDGIIVAQTSGEMARRNNNGNDATFFNTKTRRVYRLVHSNGLVQSLWFFIQNGGLSEQDEMNHMVAWSVDTRPWNPVMTVNSTMDMTFGRISDLVEVVSTDNVRVKVELEEKTKDEKKVLTSELYLEVNNIRCNNVTSSNPEVIAQSLRTVPIHTWSEGTYRMALYQPVHQYLEVSSHSGVSSTQFFMNNKAFAGAEQLAARSITWYKDGAVVMA